MHSDLRDQPERPRTVLIAEAGVNHNGDLELARSLVEAAAEAGADFCKFQTFRAERLVSPQAEKAEYQKKSGAPAETQLAMLQRLELSREAHQMLREECRRRQMGFLSTPFELESARMLSELGLRTLKISSGELTNLPFLRQLGLLAEKVILSTGMADLAEVEQALEALAEGGIGLAQVTLLHCTTQYPTPFEEVNLRAMATLREHFGVSVGLSDHTPGIEVAIAAVALGAKVIEKHLTLDRTAEGPDHAASLEPWEFRNLVQSVRRVELALGDGVKAPQPGEWSNRVVARKSVHTRRPLPEGHLLEIEDLCLKRPGSGIAPAELPRLVGRRLTRALPADHLLSGDDLQG